MIKKLFLLCISFSSLACEVQSNIVIISPSYNNAALVPWYLDSILQQNYTNYRVIYISDNDYATTSDGTGARLEEYIASKNAHEKVTVVRNKDRQLAMRNHYKAALSCNASDVIAILDGDDAFSHDNVLSTINAMYQNNDREIWSTYGNFKYKSNDSHCYWTYEIPRDVIKKNSLRKYHNGPTHLKTFKAWLFWSIKIEDFFYNGDFFPMSCDVAIFEPMYEMLGERFAYTQEVLYTYNDMNSINDHKVNRELQIAIDHYIRSKPPYPRLRFSREDYYASLYNNQALKPALVIKANDPVMLDTCISRAQMSLKNYAFTHAIVDNVDQYGSLLEKYPNLYLHEKATFTWNALDTEYVFVVHDDSQIPTIDLSDAVTWLEKTHAHAFYGGLSHEHFTHDPSLNPCIAVQISLADDNPNSVYAWQYQETMLPHEPAQLVLAHVSAFGKQPETLWNITSTASNVGLFYYNPWEVIHA